jgi:hypothetical protein
MKLKEDTIMRHDQRHRNNCYRRGGFCRLIYLKEVPRDLDLPRECQYIEVGSGLTLSRGGHEECESGIILFHVGVNEGT